MIRPGFESSGKHERGAWKVSARSAIYLPPAALTLVELLVVIIILTTLVGGVIPVLSPNNDTRKIRAAARGLQGYIAKIQAEAARTGRAQGIGVIESTAGSGVALEVFGLEVPPPFAGFSTASRARVIQTLTTNPTLYYIQFVLADVETPVPLASFPPTGDYEPDPVPPNFMQFGDVVKVGGNYYRLADRNFIGSDNSDVKSDGPYYATDAASFDHSNWTYFVEALDEDSGQTLPMVKVIEPSEDNFTHRVGAPQQYQLIRQPVNSSESPYQLPAGVAIDMQGSVVEGGQFTRDPPNGLPRYAYQPLFGGSLADKDLIGQDVFGVMFSPNGNVSQVIHNGEDVANGSRITLLLGRVENGGLAYELNGSGVLISADWTLDNNATNDELEKKQETVNWLNLDSRIVSIVTGSGRVVVSETAFVDARLAGSETVAVQAVEQLEAAHEFANAMTTVGGN
ncbi:MAG: hypothetical protein AAGD11_07790 [Planctomycetota bacterium]